MFVIQSYDLIMHYDHIELFLNYYILQIRFNFMSQINYFQMIGRQICFFFNLHWQYIVHYILVLNYIKFIIYVHLYLYFYIIFYYLDCMYLLVVSRLWIYYFLYLIFITILIFKYRFQALLQINFLYQIFEFFFFLVIVFSQVYFWKFNHHDQVDPQNLNPNYIFYMIHQQLMQMNSIHIWIFYNL